MIPRRLQLPKIVPKAKENAAHFFYGGVEQFSYERSSQAQNLTIPPNLLTAAGSVGFRRMAFRVCRERIFELIGIVADDAYLQ